MKARLFFLALLLPVASTLAADVLTTSHADLSINFKTTLVGTGTNPWRLTMRNEDSKHEYGGQRAGFSDPLEVIVRAGIEAQFEVPSDPDYAFLGIAGAPVWVLPETQEAGIVFLGMSTENKSAQPWTAHNVAASLLAAGVPAGAFTGNQVTLRLETFSGPGNFFVWQTDTFSSPLPRTFDSSNGLNASDSRSLTPGNHAHFNWAFTQPGVYELGLRASGTLISGNQFTQSEVTTFRFEIVPEPGTATLAFAGLLLLGLRRQRA